MDSTALEERVSRLEQRIAELQRENQSLRKNAVTTAVAPTENASLPRRDLFKGAAYALGGVSLSLMGTRPAEAAVVYMQVGTGNDSGVSGTSLFSDGPPPTLIVENEHRALQGDDPVNAEALDVRSSAGHGVRVFMFTQAVGNGVNVTLTGDQYGHGVFVEKLKEFGHGVLAYQKSTTGLYAAIAGVSSNGGPGLHGRGEGTGQGVWGQIADSTKSQSAVIGTTEGNGAAIEGNSILGRGGVFKGKKAAVRLVASSASNKPSTGTRGDLFVDSSGRLWYCKTSAASTGWVQLA